MDLELSWIIEWTITNKVNVIQTNGCIVCNNVSSTDDTIIQMRTQAYNKFLPGFTFEKTCIPRSNNSSLISCQWSVPLTSAITEFQAYQRAVHFNIFRFGLQ